MNLEILAVDDSRTIRDMLSLTLNQAGFTTHLAEDGRHGIEVLEAMTPPPDAIITDINMPRMDGFEFIEAVRKIEKFRTVPILVLTTESAADLKMRARQAGATGWIVKPFQPKKLIRALQMVTG